MVRSFHVLGMFTLVIALPVDAQFQVLLDGADNGTAYETDVVPASDGSMLMHYRTDSGLVLTRFGPSGSALWSNKVLPTPGTPLSLASRTAGASGGGSFIVNFRTPFQDTAARCDVLRLDLLGAPLWSQDVAVKCVPGMFASTSLDLAASDADELFMLVSANSWSTITKVSASGTPLWSTRMWGVGLADAMDRFWKVDARSDGGCVAVGSLDPLGPTSKCSAVRLDASGNVLWARTITYLAPDAIMSEPRIASAPNGDLLVLAKLTLVGIEQYLVLHRLDENGTLLWSRLYEFDQGPLAYGYDVTTTAGGGIQIIASQQGLVAFQDRAICISLDGAGEVLSAWVTRNSNDGLVSSRIDQWVGGTVGDTLHLAGAVHQQDQIFGTVEDRQSVWKVADDLWGACFLDTLFVTSYLVPPGVVSAIAGGTSATAPFTAAPSSMSTVPRPLPASSSLCLELNTPERSSRSADLQVFPNPADDVITISMAFTGGDPSWRITDVVGREVHRGRWNGYRSAIDISALPAGSYVFICGGASVRFMKN